MYESLLEHDLDDETTVVGDVATDLDEKALDADDDETDGLTDAEEVDGDVAEALDEQELDAEGLLDGDTESWSDDPVRMYLTQMGEIPLLTRQQEVCLAKQIEMTRAALPPQGAGMRLRDADGGEGAAAACIDGELPFDRTVQVSVTDQLEKHQILGRLPHNLGTLETLLKRNRRDYQHRHQQVARRRPSAGRPGGGWAAAVAEPCGWSRNSACARSGSSR